MPIPSYQGSWLDAEKNILALATHYEAVIRRLEEQRASLDSSPNAEILRAYERKALDDQLGPLRLRAEAAAKGYFLIDPRDVSGCDPTHGMWRAMAIKAGRLIYPEQFISSKHDLQIDDKPPLKVIRGGDRANNLGSPASR